MATSFGSRAYRGIAVVALLASCTFGTGTAFGRDDDDDDAPNPTTNGRFCTATTNAMFRACGFEVRDDFWKDSAICLNVGDAAERAQCYADAKAARTESNQKCRERADFGRQACNLLGEARYEVNFDPAAFETDFKNPPNLNPYFPLKVGYRWEYSGSAETSTAEVLSDTKLIEGVTCVVLRDLVYQDGIVKEATDDWFAQNKDRGVWYCGEEVKDYETFDGDKPRRVELVKIDGSFKVGRNGDKPGILFPGSPTAGVTYLEEFSLGNAQDGATVLSSTYSYGRNAALDKGVPRALAELLCRAQDCVVTKNFSLTDPNVFARKYYARGVGYFLEVKDDGTVLQLVKCNFDSKCNQLPKP